MKGQTYKRFLAILVVLCLAISLTGCAADSSKFTTLTSEEIEAWQTNEEDKKYSQEESDLGLENMREVASDSGLTLYYNDKTTEIAVKTQDGTVWYSNSQDRLNFNQNQLGMYSSQLIVETVSLKDEVKEEQNNFDKSVMFGQAMTEDADKNDNTFKVKYLFNKKKSETLFPQCLTIEKYDEIMEQLDTSEQSRFKTYYLPIDMAKLKGASKTSIEESFAKADEVGTFRKLKDAPSTTVSNNITSYMEKVGFTKDDKAEQENALGYQGEEGKTNYFTVSIQYTLKDGRLVVDVPTEDIKTTGNISILGITVLPHWNTAEGYKSTEMLIPDGSGAIVKLGEIAASPEVYKEKIYGEDCAQNKKLNVSEKKSIYFPMYGVSNKDGSMYATATGADATAYMTIHPYTEENSPGYGGFYFQLLDTEQVRMSESDDDTVTTYANEIVDDPIQVDFTFLDKEKNSWVDIANDYRERLISEKKITANDSIDKVPLSVEFLGAIDDIKTVMGVPTEYIKPLTTFSQAKTISSELVGNEAYKDNKLIVQYDAWFNGGAKSTIQNSVDPEKEVGSVSEMQELADTVQSHDGSFYPLLDYQYVYRNTAFDDFTVNSDTARGIMREAAFKADFNVGNFLADEDGLIGYLLSPAKSMETLKSFLSSYDNTVKDLKTLGLSYAASDLSSDYARKGFVTRNESKAMLQEVLNSAMENHRFLSRGANEYALAAMDVATQIPMDCNKYSLISRSVPFTQMVLAGSIMYTAETWNNVADSDYYTLRCIETGSAPDFTVIAADNSDVKYTKYDQYYAVNYDTIKDSMEDVTATVTKALSDVYGSKMVNHEQLTNNVVAVTYDNGNVVVVNYGDTAYTSPYGVVEGGSYLTAKGGNAQ